MTTRQDLHINQGETWSFVYTKGGSSPVDLTGYTARMAIRDRVGGALQAYLSTGSGGLGGTIALGGAAGTITVSMTEAQTKALASSLSTVSVLLAAEDPDYGKKIVEYVYDLEIISGAGVVTRELQGRVFINREITT